MTQCIPRFARSWTSTEAWVRYDSKSLSIFGATFNFQKKSNFEKIKFLSFNKTQKNSKIFEKRFVYSKLWISNKLKVFNYFWVWKIFFRIFENFPWAAVSLGNEQYNFNDEWSRTKEILSFGIWCFFADFLQIIGLTFEYTPYY